MKFDKSTEVEAVALVDEYEKAWQEFEDSDRAEPERKRVRRAVATLENFINGLEDMNTVIIHRGKCYQITAEGYLWTTDHVILGEVK